MILTDTHTHLYLNAFSEDRDDVMQRALDKDIRYMIMPNIDSSSINDLHTLCDNYPSHCFPMMGLHPGSVDEHYQEELKKIGTHFEKRTYYAVGEIGIDLYWDKTYKEQQKEVFRTQIEWAKNMQLPIVIHARDSFETIFEVLDDVNSSELRGVFHCFTGTAGQAEKALGYGGFRLGIGGVLTFKNSTLAEVVKDVDIKHLLLETDSPYLAPTPNRGKRNESSYVRLVADKLAAIKGLTTEQVAEITTANAEELFKIPVKWS